MSKGERKHHGNGSHGRKCPKGKGKGKERICKAKTKYTKSKHRKTLKRKHEY